MRSIKRIVIDQVPVGYYLVTFEQIWNQICNAGEHDDCLDHGCFDNGRDYISEIEPHIVRVTEKNYLALPEDVIGRDDTWNAGNLFGDDTHDLRPRLFKTLKAAKAHADYTANRFANPQPWECFFKTS